MKQHLMDSKTDVFPVDWRKVSLWSLLSLGLSVLCVAVVLRFLSDGNSLKDLFKVGLSTLAFSLAIVIVGWIFDAWRLCVLAKAMGGRLPLVDSIRISIMGSFMAGITPFDTGGEPLKMYFLHKHGNMSTGQATAAVALAAIMHATAKFLLLAVAPVVALTLGFSWTMPDVAKAVVAPGLAMYIGTLALVAASFLRPESVVRLTVWLFKAPLLRRITRPGTLERVERKVRRSATDFREAILALRSKGLPAVAALALSVMHWCTLLAVPVFILRRIGSTTSWFTVLILSLSVYLVTSYTPTPGGSGGAEVSTALFFSSVLPARILATFIVVWRVVTFYFTVVVGGLMVAMEALKWSLRRARVQSG